MKQTYIVVAALILAAVAIGIWRADEPKSTPNPDTAFTEEEKQLSTEIVAQLAFPAGVDDAFRGHATSITMQCLHQCMTAGRPMSRLVKHENCKPLCECWTVKQLEVLSAEAFLGKNVSPEMKKKSGGLFRACFVQYKIH